MASEDVDTIAQRYALWALCAPDRGERASAAHSFGWRAEAETLRWLRGRLTASGSAGAAGADRGDADTEADVNGSGDDRAGLEAEAEWGVMPNVPKWKRFETRVAKALGGERVPVTGKGRADRDVETSLLFVQCKYRRLIPSWLFNWLGGICDAAKPAGKVGILVLNMPQRDTAEALVIMRLADFRDLYGDVERAALQD
jgi:hypothetical protein